MTRSLAPSSRPNALQPSPGSNLCPTCGVRRGIAATDHSPTPLRREAARDIATAVHSCSQTLLLTGDTLNVDGGRHTPSVSDSRFGEPGALARALRFCLLRRRGVAQQLLRTVARHVFQISTMMPCESSARASASVIARHPNAPHAAR